MRKSSYALLCIALLLACTDKSDQPVKEIDPKVEKISSIIGLSSSRKVAVGDTIDLSIELSDDNLVDSAIVQMSGADYQVDGSTITISTRGLSLGRKTLGINVYFNEVVEKHTFSVELISDINPTLYGYERVRFFTHDPQAYTQGLFYHNGFLYENTGKKGQSSLRQIDVTTGQILKESHLPDQYFGEGITLWEDQIIQLTWTSNEGFVYDLETFEQLKSFNYPTEGWGITTVEDQLVMSDGSEYLYFLDPESLTETRRMPVYDDKGTVDQLNELEYINGLIYANVYVTDHIVAIDPETGKVMSKIDLTGLLNANWDRPIDVLNGIAYDAENRRLFVTGKWWPRFYEIRLKEIGNS